MNLAHYFIRYTELGVILATGLLLLGLIGLGYGVSRWLKSNAPNRSLSGGQQFFVVLSVLLLAGLVVATSEPLGDDPDAEGDYVTVEEARFYLEGLYGLGLNTARAGGVEKILPLSKATWSPTNSPGSPASFKISTKRRLCRRGIFPGEVVTYNFGRRDSECI